MFAIFTKNTFTWPVTFVVCNLTRSRDIVVSIRTKWAGYRSRYNDWLRARRSGDRIPVAVRFSAPVQTCPVTHPASCTMGTASFLGVKSGRGVTLTSHTLLVPWSRKSRAIPFLPLWTVRPVQSLSASTREHFLYRLGYGLDRAGFLSRHELCIRLS